MAELGSQMHSPNALAAPEYLSPLTYPKTPLEFFWMTWKIGWIGGMIITSAIVITMLSIGLMWGRIYLRLKNHGKYRKILLSDKLMALGIVGQIVNNALAIAAVYHGIGVEGYQIDWYQPQHGSYWVLLWGYSFALTTMPIKASVILTRLGFCKSKRWYTNTLLILLALALLNPTVILIWEAISCVPMSFLYDQVTQLGKCFPVEWTVGSLFGFAVISIIIDLGLAILPALLIKTLQITYSEKVTMSLLLAIGSFSAVCTVIRIPFISGYNDMGYWIDGYYMKLGVVVLASQWELTFSILGGCVGMIKQVGDLMREERREAKEMHYDITQRRFLKRKVTPFTLNHPKELMVSTIIHGGYCKEDLEFIKLEEARIAKENRKWFPAKKSGRPSALGKLGDGILVTTTAAVTYEKTSEAPPLMPAKPVTLQGRIADLYMGGGSYKGLKSYPSTTSGFSQDSVFEPNIAAEMYPAEVNLAGRPPGRAPPVTYPLHGAIPNPEIAPFANSFTGPQSSDQSSGRTVTNGLRSHSFFNFGRFNNRNRDRVSSEDGMELALLPNAAPHASRSHSTLNTSASGYQTSSKTSESAGRPPRREARDVQVVRFDEIGNFLE